MSELTSALVADVVAACTAGAGKASAALGRALDGAITLGAPQQGVFTLGKSPADFDAPGLVVLLTFGEAGLAVALPEASGLLPTWYAAPDAAAQSKLSTLAQELCTLLVPETLAADNFEARAVPSIREALAAAEVAADATLVALPAARGAQQGTLSLVWPLASPADMFAAADSPSAPSAADTRSGGDRTAAAGQSFHQLPHYSLSLLRIRIPVSVQLASKKETVQEVVEIVPGAIIKFDKGCDELLQMVIGGQTIAEGEAVKVGDKFGFRVTGMLLPREHFVPVRRPRAS